MKTEFVETVRILSGLFAAVQVACSSEPAAQQQQQASAGDLRLDALSVDSPQDLPRCIPAREGQVAYIRATKSLIACADRHWTPIVLSAGPEAALRFPTPSMATPAAIDAITVPLEVMPPTVTV